MLPFKKGAFRFALDLQLPILPVRLRGTDHILPSGTLDLTPGKATLTIGEPIDTSGYTEANLGELVQRARQAIEAL
jgi:1-acyl-sn-glycerol-3-phosphate acyltransferase